MFGDLNSGLFASGTTGPLVMIDVGSIRLFELVLGFIAGAAAAATATAVTIPLDVDGPSLLLLLINGATGIADEADGVAASATVATGDCCC